MNITTNTNTMNNIIRIRWKQAKILIDTLEPMVFLHTTACLMTIDETKIKLQSECREKRSVFQRTFYMPQDCEIEWVCEKDNKDNKDNKQRT